MLKEFLAFIASVVLLGYPFVYYFLFVMKP